MYKEKVDIIPTQNGYRISFKGEFLVDEKSISNREILPIASMQGYCFLKFKNDYICSDNIIRENSKVKISLSYKDYE